MKKEFCSSTITEVLGMGVSEMGISAQRTPLHVEFGSGPNFEPATPLKDLFNEETFNAVGSLAVLDSPDDVSQLELHLPVIDADGGAYVHEKKSGSKAVIKAARNGYYGPANLLRDVLGDNGIHLEVFDSISLRQGSMDLSTRIRGKFVTAIVLRAEEPGVFSAVPSTQAGHEHLYIQRQFTGEDHKVLIEELAITGLISQRWYELTLASGMGIVRTPWTDKEITHQGT